MNDVSDITFESLLDMIAEAYILAVESGASSTDLKNGAFHDSLLLPDDAEPGQLVRMITKCAGDVLASYRLWSGSPDSEATTDMLLSLVVDAAVSQQEDENLSGTVESFTDAAIDSLVFVEEETKVEIVKLRLIEAAGYFLLAAGEIVAQQSYGEET